MAKQQIHVAIVGAGLGGLAAAIGISRAGHLVTIFEQATVLGEVGAGVQIPPNSSRIFKHWGLLPKLQSFVIYPQDFIFRSYRDGKVLNIQNVVADVEEKYGAPYLHIHRADYHRILVEEAERLGVTIRLGAAVKRIDFDKPSLQIEDGGEFTADIILGADGLNSVCREALLGRPDPPHRTGDLAYRSTVSAGDIKRHPELAALASKPAVNLWLGPDAHAVWYLLKGGDLYNIFLSCPDTLPALVNTAQAPVREVLDFFRGWDPTLRSLLSTVRDATKWRLMNSREMATWSHAAGTCALLGDACHATLPNLGQGAGLAVEDGAVLGLLFEKLRTREQLRDVVVIYERLRKGRATRVVSESTAIRDIFHMRDGPAQRERDRQLLEEEPCEGYPNRLLDPEFQRWLYGYDAPAEVERAWSLYLRGRFPGTEDGFTARKAMASLADSPPLPDRLTAGKHSLVCLDQFVALSAS